MLVSSANNMGVALCIIAYGKIIDYIKEMKEGPRVKLVGLHVLL
jgi:hypothetical protein